MNYSVLPQSSYTSTEYELIVILVRTRDCRIKISAQVLHILSQIIHGFCVLPGAGGTVPAP
jgi:hypothetical protein